MERPAEELEAASTQVSGLVMLVPYGVLQAQVENTSISAFAYAFQRAGLKWASYIVSLCACTGIVTNVGINLYAASRILVAICRERLLPPAVGRVWRRTRTPIWCTLITGLICGAPTPLLASHGYPLSLRCGLSCPPSMLVKCCGCLQPW